MDILEDDKGQIWMTTRFIQESVLTFDEITQTFIPALTDRDPYFGEFNFTFDQNDDLWIASRGVGAYFFDMPSGKQTFFDPASYKIHGYRNINGLNTITDRFGNVWIAGNNLLKRPATGKSFASISSDENTVNSVYAYDEHIWYSDQIFKHVEKGTWITTDLFPAAFPTNIRVTSPQITPVKIVYCMQDFDDDHFVLSTTRNVFIWNKKTNAFKEFPLDVGGPIRELVVTPDKKNLWLCANQNSPVLLDIATGAYHRPEYASSILNVRCVSQDKNADLWFGSVTSGLYYLNAENHSIVHFSPNQADQTKRLLDYSINDIAITEEFVYIASNLGLQIINKKTNELVEQDHSFFTEYSFMSVIEDNQGGIWMGTQMGLLHYSPNTGKLRTFAHEDGLINAVYTLGACYKDAYGHLYFGGDNGVDYFDPQQIGINTVPPELYLGKVLVNNIEIERSKINNQADTLQLKHSESFLEIELLALHFTSPASNAYAYRIPELDTSWRYLGQQRKIILANMAPGRYTLQARAANADDVWCAPKSLLRIKISPPFWSTWWFITLCLLTFIGLITFVYRYRIIQIKTRERLKSEFNKRLTELESKALRSQMNPHFLFNSLNSVKSLISQGNNEKATQYITRFAQLIRQILANSERPFVRLQEELEALRLYLEIEKLRFQNFTFEIIVHDNVNIDFIEVPPLILQPYVENAIWHGLMHLTSADRRIVVVVAQDQQFLHLTIEDNGIGREQAQQIKSLGNSRKGGMGMRLTEDRLNLLKSIYGQDVNITITDLMENGQPAGTRVEVQIPCAD
jgi:two-component sensor histidine kinase